MSNLTQIPISFKILTFNQRGALAHKSFDDPSDPDDVISIQLLDVNNSRIKSKHVHQDGTSKEK